MSTINGDYTFGWYDHANNFSISFGDLLQNNELVDVKLVADGYLFDAHRLVLSALSPYFRQMFTQMPANNQQAYVFMTDVSKQTVEDLITFIYCGEVKVARKNVDDFLKTAKALNINGLADGCYEQAFDSHASTLTWSAPAYHRLQYQSSRTVQVPKSVNHNVAHSSFEQMPDNSFQSQDDFKYENANSMNESGCNHDFGNDDSAMDSTFDAHDYQWNGDSETGFDGTSTTANVPKVKRSKRKLDKTEFNFGADIRTNATGVENLFHNDFKYTKYGKGVRTQPWRCSRAGGKRCRATVTTMDIDGVLMMKVLHPDHTHPPDE